MVSSDYYEKYFAQAPDEDIGEEKGWSSYDVPSFIYWSRQRKAKAEKGNIIYIISMTFSHNVIKSIKDRIFPERRQRTKEASSGSSPPVSPWETHRHIQLPRFYNQTNILSRAIISSTFRLVFYFAASRYSTNHPQYGWIRALNTQATHFLVFVPRPKYNLINCFNIFDEMSYKLILNCTSSRSPYASRVDAFSNYILPTHNHCSTILLHNEQINWFPLSIGICCQTISTI